VRVRGVIVVGVGALIASVVGGAGITAASAAANATQTSSAAANELDWTNCEQGFQCADLRVPRDWDRPRKSEKIKLALIRLPAKKKKKKKKKKKTVGSMLINYSKGSPTAACARSWPGSSPATPRAR
jgi:hypothetical protein